MKVNLPVTQREHELPDDAILVSTTDLSGHITHCNQGFVDASGFDYDELMGQPHDIVRHPDMPPEAFKDMWSTIGHGRPWSG
ncbi:MAG: chemotaxis protein, partial [Rhodoferax sp.]|nr:chemotaxis protein [Rhodoferax sp.]